MNTGLETLLPVQAVADAAPVPNPSLCLLPAIHFFPTPTSDAVNRRRLPAITLHAQEAWVQQKEQEGTAQGVLPCTLETLA